MPKLPEITVEFYGIPRERAGRADMTIQAATVSEALRAIQRVNTLNDLTTPTGMVSSHYRLSINGEIFVTDGRQSLKSGDRLLVLSADAGG